jgi:hypothetical protein
MNSINTTRSQESTPATSISRQNSTNDPLSSISRSISTNSMSGITIEYPVSEKVAERVVTPIDNTSEPSLLSRVIGTLGKIASAVGFILSVPFKLISLMGNKIDEMERERDPRTRQAWALNESLNTIRQVRFETLPSPAPGAPSEERIVEIVGQIRGIDGRLVNRPDGLTHSYLLNLATHQ